MSLLEVKLQMHPILYRVGQPIIVTLALFLLLDFVFHHWVKSLCVMEWAECWVMGWYLALLVRTKGMQLHVCICLNYRI